MEGDTSCVPFPTWKPCKAPKSVQQIERSGYVWFKTSKLKLHWSFLRGDVVKTQRFRALLIHVSPDSFSLCTFTSCESVMWGWWRKNPSLQSFHTFDTRGLDTSLKHWCEHILHGFRVNRTRDLGVVPKYADVCGMPPLQKSVLLKSLNSLKIYWTYQLLGWMVIPWSSSYWTSCSSSLMASQRSRAWNLLSIAAPINSLPTMDTWKTTEV